MLPNWMMDLLPVLVSFNLSSGKYLYSYTIYLIIACLGYIPNDSPYPAASLLNESFVYQFPSESPGELVRQQILWNRTRISELESMMVEPKLYIFNKLPMWFFFTLKFESIWPPDQVQTLRISDKYHLTGACLLRSLKSCTLPPSLRTPGTANVLQFPLLPSFLTCWWLYVCCVFYPKALFLVCLGSHWVRARVTVCIAYLESWPDWKFLPGQSELPCHRNCVSWNLHLKNKYHFKFRLCEKIKLWLRKMGLMWTLYVLRM